MVQYRVVLLGNQGTGKTTFFNQITGSKEETRYSGQSCTRQIVQGNSICELGFEVIDTPGFNSRVEKLIHIAGILAALTYGRVDRILVVVKFGRDDEMLDQLDRVFTPVRRFKDLVTIILTHWDLSQNKVNDQKNVQDLMNKKQINSILFFSSKDQQYDICQTIGEMLLNNPNDKSVQLLESEIYRYFDFLQVEDNIEDKIEDHKVQIAKDFRKLGQQYMKFIKNLNAQLPNFLEILHQVIIQIREDANFYVEQFEKQNGDEIEKLVDKNKNQIHYLHYISLKKEISKELQSVVKFAQERMTQQQKHFYNFMRKCPHCGLIWLKVIGCDGETYCGKRVNSNFDELLTETSEPKVKIIKKQNNEIEYQINEQQKQQKDDLLDQFIKETLSFSEFGCSLTIIKAIESILTGLFGTEFRETLNKKFQQIQDKVEKSFYIRRLQFIILRKLEQQFFEDNHMQINYEFLTEEISKNIKKLGCGQKIIWSQMPLLSDSEIQALLSPELMDYFADQEQLRKDETEFLNRQYKQLINEEIKNQQKSIKIIQQNCKNQNQEQQVFE